MVIRPVGALEKTRAFVFSFDEKYAKYFSVTLCSLAAHADKDLLYDLIVLYDDLSAQTMEELRGIVPDGFSLRFFNVADTVSAYFGDLRSAVLCDQWDVSTFYDLLVPLIMPGYDRVLYCDSDIVFCEDPGSLFDLPFGGRSLIAVMDLFPLNMAVFRNDEFLKNQGVFLAETLGITDAKDYFNAGVLMFNIPAIDKNGYLEKVRQALRFPVLPTVDQDVLNYVFRGDVTMAPVRFNLQVSIYRHLTEEFDSDEARQYREAALDPAVLHYTTKEKPWRYTDVVFSDRFWKYAERSPFYERILRENIAELSGKTRFRLIRLCAYAVLSVFPGGKWKQVFRRACRNQERVRSLKRKLRSLKKTRRCISPD